MKCQKGKTCPKQPPNTPPIPKGAKICTGCDKPGKDIQPLSDKALKNNIAILGYLKKSVFNGDHPGIDRMVGEMKDEIESRKIVKPHTIKVTVSGVKGTGLTTIAEVIRQTLERENFECEVSSGLQKEFDDLPVSSFHLRCRAVNEKTKVVISELVCRRSPARRR